jgi:hypothetical protein
VIARSPTIRIAGPRHSLSAVVHDIVADRTSPIGARAGRSVIGA